MDARARRTLLIVLAALAGLATLGAAATVLLAPNATPVLLGVLLALLVAVAVAEVALILLERRAT